MKLNTIEKGLMNNPVRAALQRHWEAPLLRRLGGSVQGMHVLEIGCGRGVGTEIILNQFGAASVVAVDVDPAMVRLAEARLRRFGRRVRLEVGDAASLQAADAEFDAVFDFGIIHHIPAWRDAVRQVARVLRPRGRFFFEEVTERALDRWFYRTFLDHPTSDRFSGVQFIAECEAQGLAVGRNYVERFSGDFVIGVGTLRHETDGRPS